MLPRFEDKSRACRDPDKIRSNTACILVKNNLNVPIELMKVDIECHKCNLQEWYGPINAMAEFDLTVSAESAIFGFDSSLGSSCNVTYTFKEQAKYKWIADFNCQPVTVLEPPIFANGLLPFYIIYGSIIILFAFRKIFKKLTKRFGISLKFRKRKKGKDAEVQSAISKSAPLTPATSQTSGSGRGFPVPQVLAFQVFRGLTILLLTGIVNGECARMWFYRRSYWNGIKLSGFVVPWWFWDMGSVMYLKYRASFLIGESRPTLYWKIVKKSMLYMALGFCLNTVEDYQLSTARIPGQLQRYGLLHLLWFPLEVWRMRPEVQEDGFLQDLRDSWPQAAFALGCVLLHLLATYAVPVPDCPFGYTGPGGLHMYSAYENCTGGSARFIDSLIFGDKHLDPYPSCRHVYESDQPFDNEGLVGTLSAVLTVFGGIQAARIFVYYSKVKTQMFHLVTWGIVQIVLGLCLCGFSAEGGVIPLNRHLWSVSYALLTSGSAFLVFTLLFFVVDVRCWWSGSPCFESGLNSMLIYVGSWVLWYSFPFSWNRVVASSVTEFILMDLITVVFWIKVAIFCFNRNRIFLV